MQRTAKLSVVLALVLIVAAVLLQFLVQRDDSSREVVSIGLAETLPKEIPGWMSRDEPLGPTENAEGAVREILNYDEYVYRVFRKGQTELGLYVAYWARGRMPTRLIQLHTPDRCWIENGWVCNKMEFHHTVKLNDLSLKPAQWRTFTAPNAYQKTHVLFWLLVSGQNYDFGERPNLIPNPFRWWGQFVKEILFGYEEHYFIRLTSNVPFDQLQGDPGFQELLSALARLGLRAES